MQGYAGSITVIGSESEIGEQSSNIRWVSCIQFCRIASGKGMGPSPLPPSYGPNRLRSLGFDDRLSRSNTILNTKLKKALFFSPRRHSHSDNKERKSVESHDCLVF